VTFGHCLEEDDAAAAAASASAAAAAVDDIDNKLSDLAPALSCDLTYHSLRAPRLVTMDSFWWPTEIADTTIQLPTPSGPLPVSAADLFRVPTPLTASISSAEFAAYSVSSSSSFSSSTYFGPASIPTTTRSSAMQSEDDFASLQKLSEQYQPAAVVSEIALLPLPSKIENGPPPPPPHLRTTFSPLPPPPPLFVLPHYPDPWRQRRQVILGRDGLLMCTAASGTACGQATIHAGDRVGIRQRR
jgi:hypothetical protein